MRYDFTDFNEEWVLSLTEQEFLSNEGNLRLWSSLKIEARKEKLREVYNLIQLRNADNSGIASGIEKPKSKKRIQ